MADRAEREALAEDVVRKIEGIAIRSAVIRCYYRKEYRIAAAAINAALALPAEPLQGGCELSKSRTGACVYRTEPIEANHPLAVDAKFVNSIETTTEPLFRETTRITLPPAGASATPAPSEDGNGGSYPIFFCTCGHDRATHEISPPYPCAEDCDCKSFTFQKKTYAPNAVGTP